MSSIPILKKIPDMNDNDLLKLYKNASKSDLLKYGVTAAPEIWEE